MAKRAGRWNSSKWFCMLDLNAEAFAAAALVLDVRVVEAEAFVQALARKVQLGAVDVGQALGIDEDLDAMRLEHLVFGRRLVDILELVGQARATGRADTKAQAQALAAALDVAVDVLGLFFCPCGWYVLSC